jgi:hypothetical protein
MTKICCKTCIFFQEKGVSADCVELSKHIRDNYYCPSETFSIHKPNKFYCYAYRRKK